MIAYELRSQRQLGSHPRRFSSIHRRMIMGYNRDPEGSNTGRPTKLGRRPKPRKQVSVFTNPALGRIFALVKAGKHRPWTPHIQES